MKARSQTNPLIERSVVLVKPDGVKRGLVGDILHRFEKAGLKIVALKMAWVDREMAHKHYPESRTDLLTGIGKKTLEMYEKYGKDPQKTLGTNDPHEIGKMVNRWNIDFLTMGPVVAILLEGLHAIDNVRLIAGNTMPALAPPGTIRGDFSLDSAALANEQKRAVRNIVHAAGNAEEAGYEVELWFHDSEIHNYKRSDEDVMFHGASE